jgi:N-acyl-D-aspartate/D-glutamate deacylase
MAYDLLIKDAQTCDGAGARPYYGAAAVSGNAIVAVGNVSGTARGKSTLMAWSSRQDLLTSIRTTTRRSPGTRC